LVYIERSADDELFTNLLQGRYCHVLSPTKTGKTELLRQTEGKLTKYRDDSSPDKNPVFNCAYVSFRENKLRGNNLTTEQDWYAALTNSLARAFRLDNCLSTQNYRTNRSERERTFGGLGELRTFVRDVLLTEVSEKIVVFFDDVDELLSLDLPERSSRLKNEFFRTLGWFYDQRNGSIPIIPDLQRLTFVLSGAVLHTDLVSGDPYNFFRDISASIELEDFDLKNLQDNSEGFNNPNSEDLQAILSKTKGHPYLTMDLVSKFSMSSFGLDEYIETYVTNWETNELQFLKKTQRKLKSDDSLWALYQDIHQYESDVDTSSHDHDRLRLLGIVAYRSSSWRVHNPIFRKVSQLWLEASSQDASEPVEPVEPVAILPAISEPAPPPPELEATSPEPPHEAPQTSSPSFWDAIRDAIRQGLTNGGLDTLEALLRGFSPIWLLWLITPIFSVFRSILASPELFQRFFRGVGGICGWFWGKIATVWTRAIRSHWLIYPLLAVITVLLVIGVPKFFPLINLDGWFSSQFEQKAEAVLNKFWKADEVNEIEALEEALQIVSDWKLSQGQSKTKLPLYALQQIYYNIHEYNRLQFKDYSFHSVAMSPDRSMLAAAGGTEKKSGANDRADDYLILWNTRDLSKLPIWSWTRQDSIKDLDFSQDNQYIVMAGGKSNIKVWKSGSDRLEPSPFQAEFSGGGVSNHVSFSSDGRYIAASSSTGQINFWSFDRNNWQPQPIELAKADRNNSNVDLDNSGQCLVAVNQTKQPVQIWSVRGNSSSPGNISPVENIGSPQTEFTPQYVSLNAQGDRIALGRNNQGKGVVAVWEFQANDCKFGKRLSSDYQLPFSMTGVSFDAERKERLAVMGDNGAFQVWEISKAPPSKAQLVEQEGYAPESSRGSIQFMSGAKFVTAQTQKVMRVWSLAEKGGVPEAEPPQPLPTNQSSPASLVLRPNVEKNDSGYTTASLTEGKVILRKNTMNGTSFDLSTNFPITAIAATVQSSYLITGNDQGQIDFWNWTEDTEPQESISSGRSPIQALTWDKNKDKIAVVTENRLKFYSYKNKSWDADIPIKEPKQIQFSPDGKYLALRSSNDFELIDVENPDRSESKSELISDFEFFPRFQPGDKQVFATLSQSGEEIKVWDFSDKNLSPNVIGSLAATDFQGKKLSPWHQIQFSQAGKYMAVGGENAVHIWDTELLPSQPNSLKKMLINTFDGNWGITQDLRFRDSESLIVSGTAQLVKISVAKEEELAEMGCDWLKDYHRNYPSSSSVRICKDRKS
jgi:WD40 repeat protein